MFRKTHYPERQNYKNNIKKLKENNLLKRIGSPKGGHREVIDKGQKFTLENNKK